MVFQHIQKIQKPCLVLITAFITITFGIGTAILTVVNRPTIEGIVGDEKITEQHFDAHSQQLRLTRTYLGAETDSDEDVWADMILDSLRTEAGVHSTDTEVLADLQKEFGIQGDSEQELQTKMVDRIQNIAERGRKTEREYFTILKRNHAIDKFRKLMGLELVKNFFSQYNRTIGYYQIASPSYAETLITSEEAAEKYREEHAKRKFSLYRRAASDFVPQVHLKDRLKREYEKDSANFKVGKKVRGEYLFAPDQLGLTNNRPTYGEMYQYYLENRESKFKIEPDPEKKNEVMPLLYQPFEVVQIEIQRDLARAQIRDMLSQLQRDITTKKVKSLKEFAAKNSLIYGSFPFVLESEFEEKVPELSFNAGEIFRLKKGTASRVLPYYKNDYPAGSALVFVSDVERPHIPDFQSLKEEGNTLTAEEEEAVLKQYYDSNAFQFQDDTKYKLEVVYVDFDEFRKYHLVTSSEMKEFYDSYKKILFYETDETFDNPQVRYEIEERLKKIQAGMLIPGLVKAFKSEMEADKTSEEGPKHSFVEYAKKSGLSAITMDEPLTLEDLEKNYPMFQDSGFIENITSLSQPGDMSEVYETKSGNPFIVRLVQVNYGETPDYDVVRDKVKKAILEEEAMEKAKEAIEELRLVSEEYFKFADFKLTEDDSLEIRKQGETEETEELVLWNNDEEVVKFDKFEKLAKAQFKLSGESLSVEASAFKEFRKKAKKQFEEACDGVEWKSTGWLTEKKDAFKDLDLPKMDRSPVADRAFNLESVGDLGKVEGEKDLYLVKYAEKAPLETQLKRFQILETKEKIKQDKQDELKKQWTEYEELSQLINHKVRKETSNKN